MRISDWSSDVCSSDLIWCRSTSRHPPDLVWRSGSTASCAVTTGSSSASTGVEGHGDMGRRFATINGKRQRSGKGQALDRRPGMSRARTGAGAGCKTKKYLRSRQGRIPSVIIDWYGNYQLWADIEWAAFT